ncbi:MAG: bifunctional serine/threonine-protein kinase/formylglycine-generating enzyme family protein [Luteimonas sp.]|nr:bifunctional serine/threonine-protein kinase/formylglycine-generating enzyme family protein [Luteimonas sp.]
MTHTTHQPANPTPPEIPGYRLSRVIGRGGMSTVWLGTQLSLSREVAVKVMLADALTDEVSRRRFENEARTIARLEHPHIVGIHEVGRTREGLPWYSMPHLPKGHVGQRDLRSDEARIREILGALLSALGFAHARGVIHRDVKAENVLFDEADRPLLADFGIALRRGHGTRVTMTGLAVGSTAYMAPEQARGQQVDHRADLYSLGVLAWEMLTSQLPYKADDALAMAIMHAQNPLPKLPPELRHWQRFIDRAMAKSPGRRFHDARQMQAALDDVALRAGKRLPWLGSAWRRAADAIRALPRTAWIPVGLLVAASLGLALRDRGDHEAAPLSASDVAGIDATQMPRASTAADAASEASGGIATDDPSAALLRAAPQSDVERRIGDMQSQLRSGRITAPAGDNAVDSLLAGWREDGDHLRLPAATSTLMRALSGEATKRIAGNDDARALEIVKRASALAAAAGGHGREPLQALRTELEKALATRIERNAEALDRAAAQSGIVFAREAGLPASAIARLESRADRIPSPGSRFEDQIGDMVLLRDGERLFASMRRAVTRDEYARFSKATGREAALCRERASVLRVLSPRDWSQPGYAQQGDDPVVCISWQDAHAYAQWLSKETGNRYRLSTSAESPLMPVSGGARAIAEWRNECGADCDRRIATGRSWRSNEARRPLDASRGYDDVGFRLVRDP